MWHSGLAAHLLQSAGEAQSTCRGWDQGESTTNTPSHSAYRIFAGSVQEPSVAELEGWKTIRLRRISKV